MPFPISRLNAIADLIYPSFGTVGHFCLLEQFFTTTNLGIATIDSATDTITTNVAHKMATGARIQFDSNPGAVYVSPLFTDQDYFVYVVSPTQVKLSQSLQELEAETYIDITSAGSGARSITEQPLTPESPLSVLISHEFKLAQNPSYYRKAATNIGEAFEGKKNPVSWTIALGATEPSATYGYVLFLIDGTSTPGNTQGTVDNLSINLTPVTLNSGQTSFFSIELGFRNIAVTG